MLINAKQFQGNALIEYETFEEADAAISAMNGTKLFGRTILVNSAFMTGPFGSNSRRFVCLLTLYLPSIDVLT